MGNNELEEICKQLVMAYLKVLFWNLPERRGKPQKSSVPIA
jgi:hypothetical protein